jgi:hypothetical protein
MLVSEVIVFCHGLILRTLGQAPLDQISVNMAQLFHKLRIISFELVKW